MEHLQRYHELLAHEGVEWGLIGPRETPRLWDRHIDNCLAVTEDASCLPEGASVIDVGSGAGLPGLVWAIARPDLRVVLLEPLERRTRFLTMAVTRLEIPNVVIERVRAQDYRGHAQRVTARAVASTVKLLPWLAPLVLAEGKMLLVKGERAAEEVRQAGDWLDTHRWEAHVCDVGSPQRTRVIVAQRTKHR